VRRQLRVVWYFRKDLAAAAGDVFRIVGSVVPDAKLRFNDPDSWPEAGTYFWYREAVRSGLAQIEVCFGIP
jgi:hypothetical protein